MRCHPILCLILFLFILIDGASADAAMGEGYRIGIESRGLDAYYIEDIPMELLGFASPPLMFNIDSYNTIYKFDGVHFYLPSSSHLLDNSTIGYANREEYSNYFFFLNKKNFTTYVDFFTHLGREETFWEGRQFFFSAEYGRHSATAFFCDSDLISDGTEDEYVYGLFRYQFHGDSVQAVLKREFIENPWGGEFTLYSGYLKYGSTGYGFRTVDETDTHEIYADFSFGSQGKAVKFIPFYREGEFDMRVEAVWGDWYVTRAVDFDHTGPYEHKYYETGLSRKGAGALFLRYVDEYSSPLSSYGNMFVPGIKYELPVRMADNIMLVNEADLLFNENHRGHIRTYLVYEGSFFQGDLNFTGMIRSNIYTPAGSFDGYDSIDLFLGLRLVNTSVNCNIENIFAQKIIDMPELSDEETRITFSATWFFYN